MATDKKTAIVTGASSGLGPAIAAALSARGYNLVLHGRDRARLERETEALGRADSTRAVTGDLGLAADRETLVRRAMETFGGIDLLVNNAGIFQPQPFLEVTEATLDNFLLTNLKGTFFLTQAVVPGMQSRGGGAIVNIGTVLVDHALAGVPAAAPVASKGGIHALTVQLAAEFGKDNIRVNTVAPGIIRTPLHQRNGIDNADNLAGLHLVNRIGEPENIGSAVAHIAENDFISGAIINIDGGHVAGHRLG